MNDFQIIGILPNGTEYTISYALSFDEAWQIAKRNPNAVCIRDIDGNENNKFLTV